MDARRITQLFKRFQKHNPAPKIELNYSSRFELLIAVILSAHTTDVSVNKATKQLFKVANTPTKMLALGKSKLISHIKVVGLYNTKAINIIKTCKILVAQYKSRIPKDRTKLEQLPGVGRKTANVILNVAFGVPTIAVDTHVLRVANRLKLAVAKTPLAVERQLEQTIPERFKSKAHLWLILHGRYVCKARWPLCDNCVVADLCDSKDIVPS